MVFPLTRLWLWSSSSALAWYRSHRLTLSPLSFHWAASLSPVLLDKPGWKRPRVERDQSAAPASLRPGLLRPAPQETETSWRRGREEGKNKSKRRGGGGWRERKTNQVKSTPDCWPSCLTAITMVIHLKAIFFSRWASIFSVEWPSVWGWSSTGDERRGEEQEGGRRWEASWDCGVARSKDSWEEKRI